MKLSINHMGMLTVLPILALLSFTSYQSYENGVHIAARAADRDRQYATIVKNQSIVINQCRIGPINKYPG
jgi:Tfp pilus assembly protein PilE